LSDIAHYKSESVTLQLVMKKKHHHNYYKNDALNAELFSFSVHGAIPTGPYIRR